MTIGNGNCGACPITGRSPRTHPVYCRSITLPRTPTRFFYTMEAADSITLENYRADTLAELLKKGPLPQNDTFKILRAIFDGIKTIHEAGFAHRDIKPDNIIFVKGQPKLSDVGLLSSLSTTYTQLAGTLDFLPPEERASDSGLDRELRQINDLYAF